MQMQPSQLHSPLHLDAASALCVPWPPCPRPLRRAPPADLRASEAAAAAGVRQQLASCAALGVDREPSERAARKREADAVRAGRARARAPR